MKKIPEFVSTKESAAKVSRLSEEVLDTTEDLEVKLSGVSRRDFMRISSQYGMTATYSAAAAMGGMFSAEALAQTANTKYQKKFATKAKHVLKQGSVFRWEHTKV